MTGRRKGKFFCWHSINRVRCPNKECARWNHVADNPRACPCGTPIHFRCQRRVYPDEYCPEHRQLPEGPSCYVDPQKELPSTPAATLAEKLPVGVREMFGLFMHEVAPADVLKLLGNRYAARLLHRQERGMLSPDEEASGIRTVAYLKEREARVRLADLELNPPRDDSSDYDFGQLSESEQDTVMHLLGKAKRSGAGPATLAGKPLGANRLARPEDTLHPRQLGTARATDPEDAPVRRRPKPARPKTPKPPKQAPAKATP